MHVFFWLLVGHSLADYPLQGEFLANGKNRHTPIGKIFWSYAIFAHSMIHGGFVALFTGSIILGICEAVIHGIVDLCKCENWISLRTDQTIHIGCKILWAFLVFKGLA